MLTLALGIGANTAIFSVVHSLLLAPLPFPEPDQLVMHLGKRRSTSATDRNIVVGAELEGLAEQSDVVPGASAIWENLTFNIAGGGDPEQVGGLRVSAGTFPMLGVAPQLGRTFTDDEDAPGHASSSSRDALWRRRFSARPDVDRPDDALNGEPYEVIGVMPPHVPVPAIVASHVWVPIAFNETDGERGSHSFFAAAPSEAGRVVRGRARRDAKRSASRLEDAGRVTRATARRSRGMADFGVAQLRPTL